MSNVDFGPIDDFISQLSPIQVMANEKLKIISINANFCNNFNFWLLLNFNDPHDHLHWFYHQLHKAEIKKQKVFVLGHIAPGTHSCLGKEDVIEL